LDAGQRLVVGKTLFLRLLSEAGAGKVNRYQVKNQAGCILPMRTYSRISYALAVGRAARFIVAEGIP
jgi:hypothetical protein